MTYGRNRVEVEREIEKWSSAIETMTQASENTFPEPIL
jgi:hypothetical protein